MLRLPILSAVVLLACEAGSTPSDEWRAEARELAAQLSVERDRAAARAEHLPVLQGDGASLGPATIDDHGATLGDIHLSAASIGRGGRRVALGTSAPVVHGPEVRADRGHGVEEWWRSLERGLEHGVTLTKRLPGAGPLLIEVAVDPAHTARGGDPVELRAGDRVVATYEGLLVLDARDRPVVASMVGAGALIRIEVDDADAVYPLVVDPIMIVLEGTLGSASEAIAISADGMRAIVGDRYATVAGVLEAGAARIYLRTGSRWALEATLENPDPAMGDWFGMSVAMDATGSLVAIGAPRDNPAGRVNAGAVHYARRSGSTWGPPAVLTAGSLLDDEQFGSTVALSGDATLLAVGAPSRGVAPANAGGVDVFDLTGSIYVFDETLLPSDVAADDEFGGGIRSVGTVSEDSVLAVSRDGTRVIVGVPNDDVSGIGADAGTVRAFRRSGATWAQDTTIRPSDAAAGDQFGVAVAVDATASRVLVTAPRDDTARGTDTGSARVFLRAGSVWSLEALLSPGSTPPSGERIIRQVGLSDDGALAALSSINVFTISYHFLRRTGSTWAVDVSTARVGRAGVRLDGAGLRAITPTPEVFLLTRPNGDTCGSAADCQSGFCVDGVCCNTACGGGVSDCQACSATMTGGASGTCGPLAPAVAATITCRAALPGAGGASSCDLPETCTAASTACPGDGFVAATTLCRTSAGICDTPETCTGASASCPSDVFVAGGTTCRDSAGPCDSSEVCSGAGPACPGDGYLPGGSPCRPADGACDVAETCTGLSGACPADGFADSSRVCRAALPTPCDVAETCDGTGRDCPADGFAPRGTVCDGFIRGICDVADVCDGTSAVCLPAFRSGTVCRPAAGACDAPEACSGASEDCPSDIFLAAGVECGGAGARTCSTPGTCDGLIANCPGATVLARGTVCETAAPGVPCDADDVCDGVSDACPTTYQPASTACGSPVAGPCDASDHCAGTSADCVEVFLADVECRASVGGCDGAESCTGDSIDCPPDQFEPAGMVCRASTSACDPAESCDGTSAACPADATCSDAGAGTEAGVMADAPVADGGSTPAPAAGCSCRMAGASPREALAALAMCVALLARRRYAA